MSRTSSAFSATTLILLLAACGGGDGPTDPGNGGNNNGNGGNNGGGGNTPTVKADPSFANDIMEAFERNSCTASGCHGSNEGGLSMTSNSTTYNNLVNVASPTTGEIRVIPGNANDSYLVKKLEGRQSAGDRMPQGGSAISATDLTNIKNWINQGAKNN